MFHKWTARDHQGSRQGAQANHELPEVLLWKAIQGGAIDDLKFRRQHPIGSYVPDLYCHAAKLTVEVDGASHGAGDRPVRDERRDAWLAARGIATLRLPAALILRDVDGAVRTIAGYLQHGAERGGRRGFQPPPSLAPLRDTSPSIGLRPGGGSGPARSGRLTSASGRRRGLARRRRHGVPRERHYETFGTSAQG